MLDAFAARRPVFTMDKMVFGYLLDYKSKAALHVAASAHTLEDEQVFDSLLSTMERSEFFGTYHNIIQFQDHMLEDKYFSQMPINHTIFSFDHTRLGNSDYVDIIQGLHALGYSTMLPLSAPDELPSALAHLFDMIAVRLDTEDKKAEARLCMFAKDHGKMLWGQGVPDGDEAFLRARRLLCDLVSGDFYLHPTKSQDPIPYPSQQAFLRMMQLQDKSDPGFDEYLDILNKDVAVAYRLLYHVNRTVSARESELKNIRAAMISLGLDSLKEWIFLACFQSPHYCKNDEIVRLALTRARFLSELCLSVPAVGHRVDQLHLMGMMSLTDTIMNTDMEKILSALPMTEEMHDGLTLGIGRLGLLLQLVAAYERGDWLAVATAERQLRIEPGQIIRSYLLALKYVNDLWLSVSAQPQ